MGDCGNILDRCVFRGLSYFNTYILGTFTALVRASDFPGLVVDYSKPIEFYYLLKEKTVLKELIERALD